MTKKATALTVPRDNLAKVQITTWPELRKQFGYAALAAQATSADKTPPRVEVLRILLPLLKGFETVFAEKPHQFSLLELGDAPDDEAD